MKKNDWLDNWFINYYENKLTSWDVQNYQIYPLMHPVASILIAIVIIRVLIRYTRGYYET